MNVTTLVGDCREILRTLPDNSVHACITSPPYWGLRDYGTEPVVWGGEPEHGHAWQLASKTVERGVGGNWTQATNGQGFSTPKFGGDTAKARATTEVATVQSGFCPCGAWLGSLGLEPTPELFVQHMVEVFREVWRVLRDDGSCWINLGDSYAGSGKGPTGHNGIGDQGERQGFVGGRGATSQVWRGTPEGRDAQKRTPFTPGYKPKDLMEIPSMVVQALRADGWYLRSRIPWLKRNAMPESQRSRPSTAVEYVFLLNKTSRVYWDADAVRFASITTPQRRFTDKRMPTNIPGQAKHNGVVPARDVVDQDYANRSRRNSDWFFESWQGLLLDEEDEPLALVVNPAPFKEAHFATFPIKLVEPMVKASTSEKGVCAACGAPWARVVAISDPNGRLGKGYHDHRGVFPADGAPTRHTTGWQPTCACDAGEPVPATVLDPFGGSGTTGLVAAKFGRDAILIDLKGEYVDMQRRRLGLPIEEKEEEVVGPEVSPDLQGLPLFADL